MKRSENLIDQPVAPVVDFASFVTIKKAERLAIQAAIEAEDARQARLEQILTDILADLEAA